MKAAILPHMPAKRVKPPTQSKSTPPIVSQDLTLHMEREDLIPLKPDTRDKALKILAFRAQGMTYEELAPLVGYKTGASACTALSHAVRRGFITKQEIDIPEDRMEAVIKPKVVDNLETLLDSPDLETKREVTLKTMKHVFAEAGAQQQVQQVTAIQVNVVMPDGPVKDIRPGTVGGMPVVIAMEADGADQV
mgnify:CR=1 FL=1